MAESATKLISLLPRLLDLLLLSLLFLSLFLERLLLFAAEFREFTVFAAEDEAGVHDVEEDEGEEHGKGVEAKGVAFVGQNWVIGVDAGSEFYKTVDNSHL